MADKFQIGNAFLECSRCQISRAKEAKRAEKGRSWVRPLQIQVRHVAGAT